ncbi:MAG: GNAT family N-acetyltransferase [bacterium]|nr:GNAT family N-acetyltransferase [bacterium]
MIAAKIVVADPRSVDARWCLAEYYSELEERFEGGFDPDSHPGPSPEELTPPVGVFLVARLGHESVGCGALTTGWPGIGLITRMWVAASVRGTGLGGRLLEALEAHAVKLGHRMVRLDTNRALHEAQVMYRKRGYQEVAPFNDNPCAHLWFEKELTT